MCAARRRSAAAQAQAANADAAGNAAGNKSQLRQRRQRQPAAAAVVQGAAARAAASEPDEDPCASMPWYSYYPRQHGGVVLGAAACAGTLAFYDQGDPFMVSKLMAWLALALLALALHETRPFKRMTYGDKAKEQGMDVGVGRLLGL